MASYICFGLVHEMEAGVIERCGKFSRIVPSGCFCIMCLACEALKDTVSLRIQYTDIECETKTKDNVFVKIDVNVQFKVMEDKVPSAYYKLTDPVSQIRSYVSDIIRSSVPRLGLDNVFETKDEIANSIKSHLAELMASFGYEIIVVLVINIDPNPIVKAAMNEINASSRSRIAAAERAEAEKILLVKSAEAQAESKYLEGVGVSKQRRVIMDGLRETVSVFSNDVEQTGPKDVMDLLLITQYFDMLRGMHQRNAKNTIFLPHGPQAVVTLKNDMQRLIANESNGGGASLRLRKSADSAVTKTNSSGQSGDMLLDYESS